MSRMTSAQVISLGEYLEEDFDPASLTVSQLLGVLGFHNVNYPTPYSKPKLVNTFNTEIKAKASRFKKERLKKANSIASDDGITDGLTGKPLGNAALARRSSRRLSRVPEPETSPVRLDPPKRRRSSAQPSLGGPSHRTTRVQPALVEESEPEDDVLPVKKVGRSKKTSEAAGAHGRRVSNTAADDSGWEDNNIFQSGAESSSPTRPSPVRPRGNRAVLATRKSRKSASAPPQMHPSSSPVRPFHAIQGYPFSPPQSNFSPELPALKSRTPVRLAAPDFTNGNILIPAEHFEEEHSEDELVDVDSNLPDHEEDVVDPPGSDQVQPAGSDDPFAVSKAHSEYVVEVSQRITQNDGVAVRHRPSLPADKSLPLVLRLLYLVAGFAACATVINFKLESSSIGFCDAKSNTNDVLEQLRSRRNAVEACNRENRTLLYLPPLPLGSSMADQTSEVDLTPCPLPPLLPFLRQDTCTPCPDHATCAPNSVTCDLGYLLRPHPLLFFLPAPPSSRNVSFSFSLPPSQLAWKVLSETLDGLPGLGSVALPPRCSEDPQRKRNIGALGKAIESLLGQERGLRLCSGGHTHRDVDDSDGGEAKQWGVKLDTLKETMRKKTPAHLLGSFDDTFNEAIQQLIQWGGVIIGEDRQNDRYVAHKTPFLSWNCAAVVKARQAWQEWRARIFGVFLIFVSWLFGRSRQAKKRVESKRVADLVQIALDTLRTQELAHHTDPVTSPHPYLSSLQLRDLILQDEHSISVRSRLWDQVESVVEGNANVRANLQEIQGGDEMRVWRWVGSAGRGKRGYQENPLE